VLIASLGHFQFTGRPLTTGTLIFPVFIVAFSLTCQFLPALLAMVGFGLGMMILFNMINAILLGEAADAIRGRVMSLYTLTTVGLVPLGALASGAAANRWGEPLIVLISSVLLLAFATVLWLRAPGIRKLEWAAFGLAPQAAGDGPSVSGLPARFLWS
jgi:hypothetical protein